MSNNSASASASGGIGFTGLLAIVFIVLKLIGKIDWPWIWVLSPLWIGFAIGIIIFLLIIGFLFLVASKSDKLFDKLNKF